MNINFKQSNIKFNKGTVIIAGAGPGSINLISLKLKYILSIAEIIVYDALVNKEILSKKEQLFLYLVGTFHSSAKIALGKIENPMTKAKDLNLEQASFYIDLLDLVQEKTKDNLSDYEEQMLINTISELKMNLIDEKKNNGNKNGQKTNKD